MKNEKTWHWTGKTRTVEGYFGPVQRREFQLDDGRKFEASLAIAPYTGAEIAIFTVPNDGEDSHIVYDPVHCDWECAVEGFVEELKLDQKS